MTEKQLATIYADATAAVGRKPDVNEHNAWKHVLGSFGEAAVRKALTTWQSDTTMANDGTDRRRGEVMPKAVSLKALVEVGQRATRQTGEFRGCAQTFPDAAYGELTCGDGKLWLRSVHYPFPTATGPGQPYSCVRFIRYCDCWKRWETERQRDPDERIFGQRQGHAARVPSR